MTQAEVFSEYQDVFEYHGNTEIERIRRRGEGVLFREWLLFDSVEEAEQFFHDRG